MNTKINIINCLCTIIKSCDTLSYFKPYLIASVNKCSLFILGVIMHTSYKICDTDKGVGVIQTN